MTFSTDIAQHYSRMQIETAGHPQLIWLLHAKCVNLIKQSASTDILHRRNLLLRAQNVLAELESALKVTDELSKSLFYLYDYCYCLLDTEKEADHTLALSIISVLRDTFSILLNKRI